MIIFSAMALCAIAGEDIGSASESAQMNSSIIQQSSNPQTAEPSNGQTVKPSNLPVWKTPTWTLVARGMDLRTALDTFAVAQGISVVMSDQVTGVFSADFRDVPCEEFLERLAATHNLTWYYDGSALFIYGSGEIQTLLVDLKYMKAGEVRAMLAELGVEDARFPLRTASNDEIIMVAGPPRYVALVSELIARADRLRELRNFTEVDVRVFPLKHTWADDVTFNFGTYDTARDSSATIRGIANLVQEIMNGDRSQKTLLDGELAEGEDKKDLAHRRDSFQPIVRAENRLNAILVKDVKTRMPVYERIIKELDVPQKIVEIAVTVVEMSKQDALDWQLSLSFQGKKGETTGGVGQNAGNQFSPSAIGGMGLAGALTHIHSNYSLAASLTALREKGKARSISRSTLLTVNNMAAILSDRQSYHARVVGTEVATLQEVSAGMSLLVKPRVIEPEEGVDNPTNQIWLTMELQDGGFEAISVDSMPMTRASTLQTQTSVFEGDSIMLAGYMRDIEENAGWGIPYLRDIPLIGWLFGGSSTRKETVQRMFVFTPYVIDLDAESLTSTQALRLRDIADEQNLETDIEESDLERKRRELEIEDTRDRRRVKAEDAYKRRYEELKHERNIRKIEHKRKMRTLSEDIEKWRQEEEEARLRAEIEDVHPVPDDDATESAPEPEPETAPEPEPEPEPVPVESIFDRMQQ